MTNSNNKRIVKNTLMLFIRLFFLMGVSFYMSRVVLRILGIEDLGIYNVVGGIVTVMTFMNSSLNITTQRFLNYEMGKGNYDNLCKVFSMSFWSYSIIALIVFLLSETVGLWFLYEYLNIPAARFNAAFWVYQFSVATFIINLFTVPYTSTVIAHERMQIYAYISIGDAILKLLLVYALQYINYDKLFMYGFMMMLVSLFIFLSNQIYCRIYFPESRLQFIWNSKLFKRLLSFSGWNTFGSLSSSLNGQGVNILINIFFNSSFNGARAIAYQVRMAVNSFAANFLTATRPQIFKSYAEGNFEYMTKLIFSSSKFSNYLLLPIILPLLFNTEYILKLWLNEVNSDMVIFTQLVLIGIPISTCFPTLANASQATGKIRNYQLIASVPFILIPISTYILFKLGFSVEWAFIMSIVWDAIGLFLRLMVLKKDINFPLWGYIKRVLVPIIASVTITILLLAYPLANTALTGYKYLLCSTASIVIVFLITIWFIGLEKYEKALIKSYIKKIFRR